MSTRKEIAIRVCISVSTLNGWVSQKSKLLENLSTSRALTKKKLSSHFPEIESSLLTWFREQRRKNVPISGALLKEKAEAIAHKLGKVDFKCSTSWVSRFVLRNDISFCKMSGESKSVPLNLVETWLNDRLPSILSQYAAKDIFNADETGLFFKCLPDSTYAFKAEKCSNGKMSKERLTVFLCASMLGEKRIPIVVGKFAKPRCFKGQNLKDFKYFNNKNSWMAANIFCNELINWDIDLGKGHRKIILLIDTASVHPNINNKLENIQLEFLPANTTSILQPLDQGIIQNFKIFYRKSILTEHIRAIDSNTVPLINVFIALKFITSSWEKVKETTIKNCFKHSKIFDNSEQNNLNAVQVDPRTEIECQLSSLNQYFSDLDFINYCGVDNNLETTCMELKELEEESEDDTFKTYQSKAEMQNQEVPYKVPTISDAIEAIRNLSNFLATNDFYESEQIKKTILKIEEKLENEFLESKKKQSNLADYGFEQNK